jgi:hypothetical protein
MPGIPGRTPPGANAPLASEHGDSVPQRLRLAEEQLTHRVR